jgi:hypothetical protein
MAVYRFRIAFEDYDDVIREIDIKSNQTFEDLHRAIHQSIGYNPDYPSSFYISNDQWTKGEEITFMPNQRRIDRGVVLMDKVKLSSRIDDPHQKFYYTFNFDRPFDFHVELMKILLEDAPGTTYPSVARAVGEAPKQFGNVFNPVNLPSTSEEFESFDDSGFNPEEAEDLTEVTDEDDVEDSDETESNEEEEDEFGSEFSDNEGFDEERGGHSSHDDY